MVSIEIDSKNLDKNDNGIGALLSNEWFYEEHPYKLELDNIPIVVKRWRKWVADDGPSGYYDGNGEWRNIWRIEFETEEARTFFTLKYLHNHAAISN